MKLRSLLSTLVFFNLATVGATLKAAPPVVRTLAPTSITANSAELKGQIFVTDSNILERRFDWMVAYTPGVNLSNWTASVTLNGNWDFSMPLSNLPSGTIVAFRAWAKNSSGWGSGSIITFTTGSAPAVVPPTIETQAANLVDTNRLRLSGQVINSGGSIISQARFYFTFNTPNGPQDYQDFANLAPGTTIYYFVQASNSAGSRDGSLRSFQIPTSNPPPPVDPNPPVNPDSPVVDPNPPGVDPNPPVVAPPNNGGGDTLPPITAPSATGKFALWREIEVRQRRVFEPWNTRVIPVKETFTRHLIMDLEDGGMLSVISWAQGRSKFYRVEQEVENLSNLTPEAYSWRITDQTAGQSGGRVLHELLLGSDDNSFGLIGCLEGKQSPYYSPQGTWILPLSMVGNTRGFGELENGSREHYSSTLKRSFDKRLSDSFLSQGSLYFYGETHAPGTLPHAAGLLIQSLENSGYWRSE
jgi:hypothetical protein